MARWSNPPLTLYHGTDSAAAGAAPGSPVGTSLTGFVPSLSRCRSRTDFGLGFYTTTNLRQAQQWANRRVLLRRLAGSPAVAAVVGFDIDRDALAGFASLVFIRQSAGFWNLVTHCRGGGVPLHGRSVAQGAYDVVYGPVTLWPRKRLLGDGDQISFHSNSVVSGLPPAYLADMAHKRGGLF